MTSEHLSDAVIVARESMRKEVNKLAMAYLPSAFSMSLVADNNQKPNRLEISFTDNSSFVLDMVEPIDLHIFSALKETVVRYASFFGPTLMIDTLDDNFLEFVWKNENPLFTRENFYIAVNTGETNQTFLNNLWKAFKPLIYKLEVFHEHLPSQSSTVFKVTFPAGGSVSFYPKDVYFKEWAEFLGNFFRAVPSEHDIDSKVSLIYWINEGHEVNLSSVMATAITEIKRTFRDGIS